MTISLKDGWKLEVNFTFSLESASIEEQERWVINDNKELLDEHTRWTTHVASGHKGGSTARHLGNSNEGSAKRGHISHPLACDKMSISLIK